MGVLGKNPPALQRSTIATRARRSLELSALQKRAFAMSVETNGMFSCTRQVPARSPRSSWDCSKRGRR
jgi:hypothetical protein